MIEEALFLSKVVRNFLNRALHECPFLLARQKCVQHSRGASSKRICCVGRWLIDALFWVVYFLMRALVIRKLNHNKRHLNVFLTTIYPLEEPLRTKKWNVFRNEAYFLLLGAYLMKGSLFLNAFIKVQNGVAQVTAVEFARWIWVSQLEAIGRKFAS